MKHEGDYDHLARVKEWARGGGDEAMSDRAYLSLTIQKQHKAADSSGLRLGFGPCGFGQDLMC